MNNGRQITDGGLYSFCTIVLLEMLPYWLFAHCEPANMNHRPQEPSFPSGAMRWILNVLAGHIGGPNKSLCCTAFCPVAGLTGVAKLPEELHNHIHMANVCPTTPSLSPNDLPSNY